MKLKDFSDFFHLPITVAARKLKVCPTVIKKKCRQGGLSRWPYRKVSVHDLVCAYLHALICVCVCLFVMLLHSCGYFHFRTFLFISTSFCLPSLLLVTHQLHNSPVCLCVCVIVSDKRHQEKNINETTEFNRCYC